MTAVNNMVGEISCSLNVAHSQKDCDTSCSKQVI